MSLKFKVWLYEVKTGKVIIANFTESDVAETPDDYIVFRTERELNEYLSAQKQQTIHDLIPEITSTQTNIDLNNTNKDLIEVKPDTNNDTHKSKRGGRREGAGRKKGFQMSNESKTKTSTSMQNNQNARKHK